MTTVSPRADIDLVDDTVAEPVPTSEKVVEAAIDCILSDGFYRASTNAIARRAGVTWGVIQHHFGTREALMLAVVEHATKQMDLRFGAVEITGDTLEERIVELADVIFTFYRQPEFLAYIQVVLNIGQDPRTADKTIGTLVEVTSRMARHLPLVREQVLREHADLTDEFRFLFESLRGMAVNQQILRMLPNRAGSNLSSQDVDRDLLVEALIRHVTDATAANAPAA